MIKELDTENQGKISKAAFMGLINTKWYINIFCCFIYIIYYYIFIYMYIDVYIYMYYKYTNKYIRIYIYLKYNIILWVAVIQHLKK